ncbi:MAG TPA: F0F1 ATP synthase subunit delta [Burkholderiaceae bacterium]|nr:F0F1 ATP synthase subunit delta [Burkholderiaceae bacterium]
MAELSTIARPYADALFDAARANAQAAAQWQDAVDAVAALIADPNVASLLSNPQLSDARRFELLSGLCKQPLTGPIGELLKLVIENGRLEAIPEVAAQFRQRLNASQGVADCVIESAFALSGEDLASLLAALARKFPFQLKPVVRINSQLIGGVRVTVGDRVLDSSVRARLEAMQARLTA